MKWHQTGEIQSGWCLANEYSLRLVEVVGRRNNKGPGHRSSDRREITATEGNHSYDDTAVACCRADWSGSCMQQSRLAWQLHVAEQTGVAV